jgi:alpha-glucoside transport system substrate-binding protein
LNRRSTYLALVAGLALAAGSAAAADLKFPIGEDQRFNWKSLEDFKAAHSDLSGQTLTIFGPWRGEDETLVNSVLAYFTDATGINVKYSSSENYEQQVVIDTPGSPDTSPSCSPA